MAKKNKQSNNPPSAGMIPPQMNSTMGVGSASPNTSFPKNKKGKKGEKSRPPMMQETTRGQNLTAEQMTQMQLEEAIKESQNPSMRLKKLKSPLSIKSCFVNLALFILLTLVVAFLLVWLLPTVKVDKYDLGVLFIDLFEKTGITGFIRKAGDWFSGNG